MVVCVAMCITICNMCITKKLLLIGLSEGSFLALISLAFDDLHMRQVVHLTVSRLASFLEHFFAMNIY